MELGDSLKCSLPGTLSACPLTLGFFYNIKHLVLLSLIDWVNHQFFVVNR